MPPKNYKKQTMIADRFLYLLVTIMSRAKLTRLIVKLLKIKNMIAIEFGKNHLTYLKSRSIQDMEEYLKFHSLIQKEKSLNDFKYELCGTKMDHGYIPDTGIWFQLSIDGRTLRSHTDISPYINNIKLLYMKKQQLPTA